MPIHVPGKRDRHGKMGSAKRSAVAVLSLTAMVDLFTVLVVFLLQNYATTGEILEIPEGVDLPIAKEVKELKPANVVVISQEEVRLNDEVMASFNRVRDQQDWVIDPLLKKVVDLIKQGEKEKKSVGNQIRSAVERVREGEKTEDDVDAFRKITIQADKEVDFLTMKKVMYTVTEAGVYEINFAVMKRVDEN